MGEIITFENTAIFTLIFATLALIVFVHRICMDKELLEKSKERRLAYMIILMALFGIVTGLSIILREGFNQ